MVRHFFTALFVGLVTAITLTLGTGTAYANDLLGGVLGGIPIIGG
ncbi:hypothetical protein HDA32_003456 [Spinactinospora alkalitolerans]|uniref:Uncharacterized protein n=1 Tax=Spinactinospora alkalitolerans TaxID=687207 RepID=A0A852TV47_9ACTN|nr:hypothetical protein [Spinactinospora alkalitolerans]NYE48336.1 hypothetical protein [Spinactinospora alkalitolerans]